MPVSLTLAPVGQRPLRVLIVDDEPIARRILQQELECLSNVEVVGEAANGEVALAKISELSPDLLFLDIQMPVMGGFEVLNRITGGHMPVVVMLTAFDQYAIRAFEAGAVDYLLKPVGQMRLQQSVARAVRLSRNPLAVAEEMAQLQQLAPAPGAARADAQPRKIVGRAGDEYFLLNPAEVLAFQSDGGPGLDIDSETTLSCDAEFENTGGAFGNRFFPADSQERTSEYQSDSEDEFAVQPALAGDSEQRD